MPSLSRSNEKEFKERRKNKSKNIFKRPNLPLDLVSWSNIFSSPSEACEYSLLSLLSIGATRTFRDNKNDNVPLVKKNKNATGRERKEDGKPCVTSVTIILLRQLYFPLNRSFCKGPENIGVKRRSRQNTQVTALPSPATYVTHKCFAFLFFMLSCCVNSLL